MSSADAGSQRRTIVQQGRQVTTRPRKKLLDKAHQGLPVKPSIGRRKKSDLSDVFVHKFKLNNQETFLAHELRPHKNAPTEAKLLAVLSNRPEWRKHYKWTSLPDLLTTRPQLVQPLNTPFAASNALTGRIFA